MASSSHPRHGYREAVRIDLHTHSTASDGTDAPAQVVADAAAAGLDVVALTDHDTTAGWAEAAAAARAHGIALVRGTEVSARAHGISIHLLSYLQDPTHPALTVELDRTRDARAEPRAGDRRAARRRRADHLGRRAGALPRRRRRRPPAHRRRPGRARASCPTGTPRSRTCCAPTVRTTCRTTPPTGPTPCARSGRPAACPCSRTPAPTPAGGSCRTACSTASPRPAWAGSRWTTATTRPAQRARLTAIADRLGLLVTGSSDYHGAGKANRLGENLTAPDGARGDRGAGDDGRGAAMSNVFDALPVRVGLHHAVRDHGPARGRSRSSSASPAR